MSARLLGGLASAWTARIPPAPLTTGVVIGWGVCLLPLGLGAPQWLGLAAFGVGAFLYAPYLTASTVLLQRATPRPLLPRVLALRTSMVNFAVPLGAVLAGPLLVDVGARRVILASALATVALGVLAAAVTATVLLRPTGRNPAATPRPADDDGPPAHDPDDLPGRDRA